jgi:formate dehydrogenase maturation protein FdhE
MVRLHCTPCETEWTGTTVLDRCDYCNQHGDIGPLKRLTTPTHQQRLETENFGRTDAA